MYTLKSIARRGTHLGAAIALILGAIAPAVLPAVSAYADALNPLTKRSLTLSSSSPGWDFKDGSGNALYAPPNSGANGQKTGNTFSFNVSTDSSGSGTNQPIKAMSFQYCTTSAGNCLAPGNDGYDTTGGAGSYTRKADSVSAQTSDLNVVTSSASELSTLSGYVDSSTGIATAVPAATSTGSNFVVYWNNAGTWTISSGWTMQASNVENSGTVGAGTATGKNNYITLVNSSGLGIPSDTTVKVIFYGTNSNYITNPGTGAFFVKINTYNAYSGTGPYTVSAGDVIDGGVTVANVMNQSIEIQTKVLETMDFSVGTVDPYTLDDTQITASSLGQTTHGQCDRILPGMTEAEGATGANTLALGDQNAESSLSTSRTYSTHSYWRLSSNSSGGATVYYSGSTLSNTENDQIKAIGTTAATPTRGTEQFGLALDNGSIASNQLPGPLPADGSAGHNYPVSYAAETDSSVGGHGVYENGADNGAHGLATYGSQGVDASVATDITAQNLTAAYHDPQLYPLVPEANYDQGQGTINTGSDAAEYATGTPGTKFAFDTNSMTIPAPIATESSKVVDCVTGKMRYIANIAATTPAGIYTTKVNYIAAPQY